MYSLESEIRAIADRFISELVSLIRRQPFAESAAALAPATPRSTKSTPSLSTSGAKPRSKAAASNAKNARRTRRSSDEVLAIRDRIIALVKDTQAGLSVSEIAARLDIPVQDVIRPLTLATQSGALVRQGEKRLARYFPAQKAA